MDELLVAVVRGGELVVDLCVSVLESVFSRSKDDEDESERPATEEDR